MTEEIIQEILRSIVQDIAAGPEPPKPQEPEKKPDPDDAKPAA